MLQFPWLLNGVVIVETVITEEGLVDAVEVECFGFPGPFPSCFGEGNPADSAVPLVDQTAHQSQLFQAIHQPCEPDLAGDAQRCWKGLVPATTPKDSRDHRS